MDERITMMKTLVWDRLDQIAVSEETRCLAAGMQPRVAFRDSRKQHAGAIPAWWKGGIS